MEAISAAAAIVALIQVSGKVFGLCREYYLSVRDARKDIQRLTDELTTFHDVLENIAGLVEGDSAKMPTLRLLSGPDGLMAECMVELETLETKLSMERGGSGMKRLGRRIAVWPLTEKEVNRSIQIIERYKATFNTALMADQARVPRSHFLIVAQSNRKQGVDDGG